MRLKNLFLTIAMIVTAVVAMAQTNGFSYQAVVRDSKGEIVKNQKVGLKLTLADNTGTKVMYEETQTATTSSYGVLTVTIGEGKPQNNSRLSNVNWASGNVWLHIAIDVKGGTSYTEMGATKIQAVPVALYAARSGNSTLNGNAATSGDALFEVKDNDGNLVFAVYPNSVKVYVDEEADSKAKRSGFVVTGRKATKDDEDNDYFAINANGTQVFVDDQEGSDKAKRSGFVVTGRKATKDDESNNFFAINADGTQVFVDDQEGSDKAKRSGFVVTGRKATKVDENNNFFAINADGTQVFVDDQEGSDKAKRSGFVVTGRKATKDNESLFAVDANHTTGDNTAALGEYAEAKGKASTAMGNMAKAPGDFSSAFGHGSEANGEGSFAAGYQVKTEGNSAVALGYASEAIGDFSLALGDGAKATGRGSCAIGILAEAKDEGCFSIGQGCKSESVGSVAMGYNCEATGTWSVAFGSDSKALDHGAVALGKTATAEGSCSFATGELSVAKGSSSVAFGFRTEALGSYSVAIGPENVSAEQESVTFGKWLYAKLSNETVVGSANDTTCYGVSGPIWSNNDRLFTIGNGKQSNERSNAMVVLKKGSIGIGTSKPAARLEINGSIKANRIALTSDYKFMKDSTHIHNALEKVLALQGITYHWKPEDDIKALYGAKEQWTYQYAPDYDCAFTETTQAGFAADEVESVIPELVFIDANNFKSIDYMKMNAYLVEAVKEQQAIIKKQNDKIADLESKINEILQRLNP